MATMRGIAVEVLARVRHRPARAIAREELRLLRLLSNVYGSVRDVRQLWESEGQSLLPLEEHRELIRGLLAEELLFSPHAIPDPSC